MTDFRIDSHKLMFHPKRVAAWQLAGDEWELAKSVYPIYVEVSPVGACNHRCTFCAVDFIGYKSVQLETDLLCQRLDEMAKLGVRSIMLAGEGEPLLHKNINNIVRSAVASGIDVAITTNGVLLDKLETIDLCSWVKVSVNAGTRETYSKVHRTKAEDFDRVWKNIELAAGRKGDCALGVQMVVLPENEHEQRNLVSRATIAGVDYVVFKPYSQHKFSITHEYEHFRAKPDYAQPPNGPQVYWRDDAPSHEPQSYTKCHATPNFWAYIMATGDVYSCSAYLLDERFKLGNINELSFREIWHSEARRRNWELVRHALDIGECRRNCRMHKTNEYLDALVHGVEHMSFI